VPCRVVLTTARREFVRLCSRTVHWPRRDDPRPRSERGRRSRPQWLALARSCPLRLQGAGEAFIALQGRSGGRTAERSSSSQSKRSSDDETDSPRSPTAPRPTTSTSHRKITIATSPGSQRTRPQPRHRLPIAAPPARKHPRDITTGTCQPCGQAHPAARGAAWAEAGTAC
jgi:hypothetical protein